MVNEIYIASFTVLKFKSTINQLFILFSFIKILRVGEDKNQWMGSEKVERPQVHDSRFFFLGFSTIQEKKNIQGPLIVANFC